MCIFMQVKRNVFIYFKINQSFLDVYAVWFYQNVNIPRINSKKLNDKKYREDTIFKKNIACALGY